MNLFKQRTMGHYLIMGRKTYESIGRPLPGRKMVVITRQEDYQAEGCTVVHSLQEALDLSRADGETEAFIGGGAAIYTEALPFADRLYLTQIDAQVPCDVFFPDWDQDQWQVIQEQAYSAGEKDQFPFVVQTLERQ